VDATTCDHGFIQTYRAKVCDIRQRSDLPLCECDASILDRLVRVM